MSLYNVVSGFNPNVAAIVHMTGIDATKVARFRDAWLSDDGKTCTILTRTGGGNREDYMDWIRSAQNHPLYISDKDDDFDSTYAEFNFKIPEQYHEYTSVIADGMRSLGKGAETQGIAKLKSMIDKLMESKSLDELVTPEVKPEELTADHPDIKRITEAYGKLFLLLHQEGKVKANDE
jgi:hypothetical protein